jgi:imidazolonepropionase-like amidohydrolase
MVQVKRSVIRILALVPILLLVYLATGHAQTKRIKPAVEHLVFKCKVLVNPRTGVTISNALIETSGGRVLRIGKQGDWAIPDGVKVVDYSDKYVIPGLIDTHGHLYGGVAVRQTTSPFIPILYLASGVTSVRAPGSMDPGGDLAMRERINSGKHPGPRYFLAGEYLEMAPVTVAWMNPVATPEEARLKVDYLASMGVDAIKLYANMSGDVMQATIEAAHEHGLKAIAHIGAVTYMQAMDMGIDELFHGALAFPDAMPPGLKQTDYKAWSKATGEMDLTQPNILEVLRRAAAQRVVLTPTAVVLETMEANSMQKHHMEEQKKFYAQPAWDVIEKLDKSTEPPRFGSPAEMTKSREFIRRAYEAGCVLSTGTDLVMPTILAGYSLYREMEIFAESGMKPMDILKAATINGAFAIGRTDELGTVEPGKFADFVALNADPLENISNVRSVYRVVKGGVIYEPEVLLKPLVGKIY